jgi:uncharacterized protein (TIGR00251 family)
VALQLPEPIGATWPCLSVRDGVTWLEVSVSPNARQTRAEGLHDGALRVRLSAPPVDGKANAMLVAWIAAELGLAQREVRVARGDTARRKCLALDVTPAQVARWLHARVGAPT